MREADFDVYVPMPPVESVNLEVRVVAIRDGAPSESFLEELDMVDQVSDNLLQSEFQAAAKECIKSILARTQSHFALRRKNIWDEFRRLCEVSTTASGILQQRWAEEFADSRTPNFDRTFDSYIDAELRSRDGYPLSWRNTFYMP